MGGNRLFSIATNEEIYHLIAHLDYYFEETEDILLVFIYWRANWSWHIYIYNSIFVYSFTILLN